MVGDFWARALFVGAVAAALVPVGQCARSRWLAKHELDQCERLLATGAWNQPTLAVTVGPQDVLLSATLRGPSLASWQSIGGCGVGGAGASSAAGGVKWVGRNVTGGLVGMQCLTSMSSYDQGNGTVLNTRLSADRLEKWILAADVPFLFKVNTVDVFGQRRTAKIMGWGDLSLELGRKLGITNATSALLSLAVPTGSHDAVRQGVVLPQQAQLGAGRFGGALNLEHTFDQMWGMVLLGGNAAYGGGQNSIGDYRASSASAYSYVGYLLGPFVPSAGLSLAGKLADNRQRFVKLNDQSRYTASLQLGLEWSNDWVAVLFSGSSTFSLKDRLEAWTIAVGAATSVF